MARSNDGSAAAAIVMDNGTGYTKLGFAGNDNPQFIIPTAIATRSHCQTASDEFDFFIGDEALQQSSAVSHQTAGRALHYPIRHGQIDNWDLMESYWEHCFFRYLRCDPEAHPVLLTEPPLNTPENRESTAEVMFETFNVPALHIGVQAVLALAASWLDPAADHSNRSVSALTGTVVDSGDGVTHIIPVVDGYAIGSAIKHVPMAGRELTLFLQQMLRDRKDVSLDSATMDTMELARRIKADCCFVSSNPMQDLLNCDRQVAGLVSGDLIQKYSWCDARSGRSVQVSLGIERFMTPEVFFNPDLLAGSSISSGGNAINPLPQLLDDVIQNCPIDCRRALYGNIVLSGGSTMFPRFADRLQKECSSIVQDRLAYRSELKSINADASNGGIPQVRVIAHSNQRHAVWTGGSLLASMDNFVTYCHTKAQYDEYGPSLCRSSRVFTL